MLAVLCLGSRGFYNFLLLVDFFGEDVKHRSSLNNTMEYPRIYTSMIFLSEVTPIVCYFALVMLLKNPVFLLFSQLVDSYRVEKLDRA